MRWPVIQSKFPESREATAPPMSSGKPTRPSAMVPASSALSFALSRTAETVTAQDVAYRVGYESPSQFSREYNRAFGAPPRRDRVLSTHDSEA